MKINNFYLITLSNTMHSNRYNLINNLKKNPGGSRLRDLLGAVCGGDAALGGMASVRARRLSIDPRALLCGHSPPVKMSVSGLKKQLHKANQVSGTR